MFTLSKRTTLCMLIIGLLPVAATQAAEIPLRGPIPFESFDKDGNKMISPQEFVETHNQRLKMRAESNMPEGRMSEAPGFTYFDSNRDNQISEEELAAGRSSWQQQRGGMGPGMRQGMGRGMDPSMRPPMRPDMGPGMRPGMGPGMGHGMQMPTFADCDLNGDGAITKDEFGKAREKRMAKGKEMGYPMRNAGMAPPFEYIDANNDGKISQDEFSAHQAQHQRMMRRNMY